MTLIDKLDLQNQGLIEKLKTYPYINAGNKFYEYRDGKFVETSYQQLLDKRAQEIYNSMARAGWSGHESQARASAYQDLQTKVSSLEEGGLYFPDYQGGKTSEAYQYFTPEAKEEARIATGNFGMGADIPADQYTGETGGYTSGGVLLYKLKNGSVTATPPPGETKQAPISQEQMKALGPEVTTGGVVTQNKPETSNNTMDYIWVREIGKKGDPSYGVPKKVSSFNIPYGTEKITQEQAFEELKNITLKFSGEHPSLPGLRQGENLYDYYKRVKPSYLAETDSGMVGSYTHPVTGEILTNVPLKTIQEIESQQAGTTSDFQTYFAQQKAKGIAPEQIMQEYARIQQGGSQNVALTGHSHSLSSSTSPTSSYVYGNDALGRKANNSAVNHLYQAYFGRNATQAELDNWGEKGGADTTVKALEDFLKAEQIKYGVTPRQQPLTPVPPQQTTTSPTSGTQPKYQILNVESMGKYSPDQYERMSNGAVVLKPGVTPIAGTVKEIGAQQPSGQTSGQESQPNGTTKTFYRDPNSHDIYDASTGQKISYTDWTNNWSGKATEVAYPGSLPAGDSPTEGSDMEGGLSSEQRQKIASIIAEIDANENLSNEQKLILKEILSRDYTSGQVIPTTQEVAKIIEQAAKDAEADLAPYYKTITTQELQDLQNSMADIRNQAARYSQQEAASYKKTLAETKQSLRTRGMTFSGTSRATLGHESALSANQGQLYAPEEEGSLPMARRYNYEDAMAPIQERARDIGIASERKLGSAAIQSTTEAAGGFINPYDGKSITYQPGRTQPLYKPFEAGTEHYVSPTQSTIGREKLAETEASKWRRIGAYSPYF